MKYWQTILKQFSYQKAAIAAQSVRVFTYHAKGCVFESQPRQTQVVKTGIDRSTAKHSTTGVSVTGPRR